jgi:hypothetical protein
MRIPHRSRTQDVPNGHGETRRSFATQLLVLPLALICLPGCYNFRAPFDKSVRTVYVPTFKSQTFRRDMNFTMTDLVIKEIEKRTPYKVVGNPEGADTILDGTVNFADKNLVVENPNNYPRQLTAMINATVSWTPNPPTDTEVKNSTVVVAEQVNFVPEVGETSMTAFYQACQRIATQIVDMMEEKWEGGDPTALPPEPEDEPMVGP